MSIVVTVSDRVASVAVTDKIVAGNTYPVTFTLDAEWTGTLYVRVRFGSQYYDIPMESSAGSANVQMPIGYPEVGIGVFSEALEICTNEVRLKLLKSILEEGTSVVEFDSDLYDQWTGEVTELLTDDDWSDSSTKPIQNRIITAWKGTVAIDSDVVHKAGSETITGAKTFTASSLTLFANVPYLNVQTSRGDQSRNERYGALRYLIQPEGQSSYTEQGYVDVYSYQDNPRVAARMRVYNHGRSVHADMGVVAKDVDAPTNPGAAYVSGTSYYPEQDGVRVPPSENVIVTEGMLAADPQVVHTTGNESIAGAKTFLDTLNFDGRVNVSDLRYGYSSTKLATAASEWYLMYTFATDAFSRYRVSFDDLRSLGRPVVTLDILSRPANDQLEGRITSNDAPIRLARRADTGVVEVWLQIVRQGSSNPSWVGQASLQYGGALTGHENVNSANGPAVGDTYDKVVEVSA